MPEESYQEKTEQATPKRRQDAREKGQVAKSIEINSAVILLVGVMVLYFAGPFMYHRMAGLTTLMFENLMTFSLSAQNLQGYFLSGSLEFFVILSPIFIALIVVGLLSNVLQVGFLFSPTVVAPKFSKLNPMRGFRQLFSKRSMVELTKSIIKIVVVGFVLYSIIKRDLDQFVLLFDKEVGQIYLLILKWSLEISLKIILVLLFLAILDYGFQRYEFEHSLRMTRQEVVEERKQMEGDPQVKSRIKSIRREMLKRRMMHEVPKATVVITNPVFIAIALRYVPEEKTGAPLVLAKGKRKIAEKIREIALAHQIPLVENKVLARAMYDVIEIGEEIPAEFFTAVAEILAYVYRLKGQQAA